MHRRLATSALRAARAARRPLAYTQPAACAAPAQHARNALPLRRPVLEAQVARFSSDAKAPASPSDMSENAFMELADDTLDDIQNWLDGVEEMLEDSDIMLSQGVLKIDLGSHGTWVINRQVPNRQIWWSSPISGPRRYEYDSASGKWLNTRDHKELMALLRAEVREATGIQIFE